LSYSRFIHGLKLAEVDLNRKVMADIAVRDEVAFANLVEIAKDALVN
jgi:large subunit ribosomal protein L20